MKKEMVKELFHRRTVKISSIMLAMMIAAGGFWAANQQGTVVPELVTFVDTEESLVIEEDEVPLAAPKVTKSTKTTKKTKKIKMKKASKKTYTKAGKTTKKTKTKTTKNSKSETTTKTETQTNVTNKYKKGSKINTQVTTVKTTVTKTVVTKQNASAAATNTSSNANESSLKKDAQSTVQANGQISVKTAAPKLNSQVAAAYEKLHFTVEVNNTVAYSGKFSAKTQNIILKKADDTIYHEFGHFVAFAAGNADMTSEWKNIYNTERSLYTASNKAYVLSTASEYFAESFKEYTLDPGKLKAARPNTYAAIDAAVAKITDAQTTMIWNTYKSIWK